MIHLEIVESPDRFAIGPHLHQRNHFSIGANRGDLCLCDPDLKDYHIQFEVRLMPEELEQLNRETLTRLPQGHLLIELNFFSGHYYLNGQKTTGPELAKINDRIKFGNTLLTVKDFHFQYNIDSHKSFKKNYSEILQKDEYQQLREIIGFLEDDYQKLWEK